MSSINKVTMNRLFFLIVLTVVIISCSSIRTRNLTGRIVLDEIKESSDTVDFYIKQIELINVEKLQPIWVENTPVLNLTITIKNKFNKHIYLVPSNWSESYFVGILPQKLTNDTIDFVNFFRDFPKLLGPASSVDFRVSSFSPLHFYFDETQLNYIEPMLALVKQLKLYYAPLSKEANMGQDTVVINWAHRLRTDANTKITSWSRIR